MKRVLMWIGAWMVVITTEAVIAIAAAGLTAMVMIPAAKAERGYDAIGGEWLAIGGVLILTFCLIHRRVCNKVFGERTRKRGGKNGIFQNLPGVWE